MGEYYIMKVAAGISAGGILLCVLLLVVLLLMHLNVIDTCDEMDKAFKLVFTVSGITAVVIPFIAENAEYHIIHDGRNYFTNEIIYLKDGGIHFQGAHYFGGGCVTFEDDNYIINKI